MGQTTTAGTRCARCSAAVRPGAPWCTQCYAPTGDPVEPAAVVPADVVPAAVVPAAVLPADPPTRLPTGAATGTWPCTTCSQANDLALPACEACGTPFLAAARDALPSIVLPVVGDLLALSPVRRVGLAAAVVVVFVVVGALLALLLA